MARPTYLELKRAVDEAAAKLNALSEHDDVDAYAVAANNLRKAKQDFAENAYRA